MRAGQCAAQVDPAILAAILCGGGEPHAPAALVLEDACAPCMAGAQLLPALRPVAPNPNLRLAPHALHRSFVTACSPCVYFNTACAVWCSSVCMGSSADAAHKVPACAVLLWTYLCLCCCLRQSVSV